MARLIRCACGQALQVPADAAGKQVRCPACKRVFTVAPPAADPGRIRATPAPPTAPPRAAVTASPGVRLPAEPPRTPPAGFPAREGRPSRFLLPPGAALPAALAGAVLGLVLLCGGGAGLFVLLMAWRSTPARVAERPPTPFPELAPPMPAVAPPADAGPAPVPAYQRPDWFPAPGPKLDARRQARRDWLKQTCRDAYDRCGRKDPRWDAAAHEALAAFEAFHSRAPALGDEEWPACTAARRAVEAGCDDPLIQHLLFTLSSEFQDAPRPDLDRLSRESVAGMERSPYPAVRRLEVLKARARYLAAGRQQAPERAGEVRRLLDACCALLPEVVRDGPPAARERAGDPCVSLLDVYRALDNDRQPGYRKLADALEKGGAPEAFRLWVEGTFDAEYAWDARGNGFANTVTEEGWRGFRERLGQARAALERAWQLDPSNARVAAEMITVCMGQGRDREEMETWFRRAMEADPDCYTACDNKLRYLQPKWHGSVEEALAFARECAGTGDYGARLPFLLPEAHLSLAGQHANADAYFTGPEVWPDVQAVYEPYLKRHPDSKCERTYFARWGFWCQHYLEAKRQFDLLGDQYWRPVFRRGGNTYEDIRDFLNQVHQDPLPPGQQPPGPPPEPPSGNAVRFADLEREPAKYAGKELEVQVLLAPGMGRLPGLYLLTPTRQAPRTILLRTPRDVAAEWFTDSAGQPRWARVIGRLEPPDARGQNFFNVSRVVRLDPQGRAEKTYPSEHPTVPSLAPTLGDVDRTPEAYARRTVMVRAGLRGGFVSRDGRCELEVLDEEGVRPSKLLFHTARPLAERWAAEGRPEKPVPADLVFILTREKAGGRYVVEVKEIHVLGPDGFVAVKTIQ
jgi:hypothetical protein